MDLLPTSKPAKARYWCSDYAQCLEHPETGEVLIHGHLDYDDLSSHERVLFDAWLLREILQMQNVMQLHKQGLLEKVDYLGTNPQAPSLVELYPDVYHAG